MAERDYAEWSALLADKYGIQVPVDLDDTDEDFVDNADR